MRIQAIDDWKAMACLFDQPSTSRVVKVLQSLPADFWVLICSFLPINDWGNLEFVSKRMHMVMKTVWKSKRSAILDADLVTLARLLPDASSSSMSRFSLPPDNLWTHLRSEVDFLLPREVLMLAYPDLGYWAKKCSHVQSITFLEAPYKSHRVPVGRSFFRFLATGVFDSLTVLDLTMTSFELADFEQCDQTFPDLQHLIVDRCCIYMYRRDILTTKPDNELRSTMLDYAKQRKKMRAGTKLFLATVIDCYRQLRHVSASSTEYRSNGCITFGYGEEENDAVYEFAPRMRRSSYCAALLKRAVAQFNNRVNNNVEQRIGYHVPFFLMEDDVVSRLSHIYLLEQLQTLGSDNPASWQMRIQAIDDWKAMACLFDQPSTSRVVKVLQLLPADFWVLICSFLPINDWGNLELVSKRMHMVMKTVWKSKRSAILDADLVALARLLPDASSSSMSRFSLPPDNLWTHLRSEVDFLLPREVLMLAYPDLGYWAKKCSHVQSIAFLEAPYKSHRVPVGRSFFRFLAIGVFDSLTVLDLTMTSFELADFEHCDQTFPDLQHLIVDRCCIYMYRRDILTTKPDNELRSTMLDYAKQRKKMRAGTKLFLATVIDCYRQLRHVSASSTEYRSNGCITFGYGEEENDAVYEFAPRMRRSSYCAALLKRAVAQFNNRVNNNVEQRV